MILDNIKTEKDFMNLHLKIEDQKEFWYIIKSNIGGALQDCRDILWRNKLTGESLDKEKHRNRLGYIWYRSFLDTCSEIYTLNKNIRYPNHRNKSNGKDKKIFLKMFWNLEDEQIDWLIYWRNAIVHDYANHDKKTWNEFWLQFLREEKRIIIKEKDKQRYINLYQFSELCENIYKKLVEENNKWNLHIKEGIKNYSYLFIVFGGI